ALVSLPDFDPNDRRHASWAVSPNRVVSQVHEMGAIFEIFSTALALEQRRVTLRERFDVGRPLYVGRTNLRDEEPYRGALSVAHIFSRSSVRGAARIARLSPPAEHYAFLQHAGLLERTPLELGETIPAPLFPRPPWGPLTGTTVGYGYGVAVTPLQAAVA